MDPVLAANLTAIANNAVAASVTATVGTVKTASVTPSAGSVSLSTADAKTLANGIITLLARIAAIESAVLEDKTGAWERTGIPQVLVDALDGLNAAVLSESVLDAALSAYKP